MANKPLWHIAMDKWTRGLKRTPEEDEALETYLNGWWKTLEPIDPDKPLGDKF